MDIRQFSTSALAYLGDAVFELKVREKLIRTGIGDSGKLNAMAAAYVRAGKQSDGLERIEPLLTEEEAAVCKRGRNSHSGKVPKSASVAQYRRATGLETLFAHLYVTGQTKRLDELFDLAFPDEPEYTPIV